MTIASINHFMRDSALVRRTLILPGAKSCVEGIFDTVHLALSLQTTVKHVLYLRR